jgi:anthranilate synthase component I
VTGALFEPAFEAFASAYAAGRASLVVTRLVGDLETPVSAYLKLTRGAAPGASFLLESVEGGAARGRYSMIGFVPDILFRVVGDAAFINRDALRDANNFAPCDKPPLDALRALIAESAVPQEAGLPPMAAGVFGYLGYDMVRLMERLPAAKEDRIGAPDSVLMRPTIMVVFDSVRDEISIVTPARPRAGVDAKAAYEEATARLDAIVERLEAPLDHRDWAVDPHVDAPQPQSNTPEPRFLDMVARAKEYIRAGDIFQVVLSQRFSAPFALPAFALYRALRRVNPAPFLCYLDFADFQIVCSSPEILVRAAGGKVTIRPIAGTRWRGADAAEDARLAQELLADEKERAEHLMLLDLGRNDVGRVAKTGTVKVTDSFTIERYSHVMHIVSNVEGELDETRFDCIDALAAGFPAGTVSGAPKVRAMEIIDELEADKRGIYGGCIGYFGSGGQMDTCIVLRTAVVKDGVMHVQAGAGVVYDSDPAYEHRECVNKAKALFRAAEEAVRFAARTKRGQ